MNASDEELSDGDGCLSPSMYGRFTEELQSRKLDCERVIKTGSKRNVTWLRSTEKSDPWEVQRKM